MKKVLTILAIMIVATCVVFAADGEKETHKIQIKTIINEVVPQFQLYLTDARKTNTTPKDFGKQSEHSVSATETSDINFSSDVAADRTATVVAKLLNPAKTIKLYTLSFSDGVFTVAKGVGADKDENVKLNPTITVTSKVAATTDGVNAVVVNEKDAAVQFNGTTCVAKDLVSVTYVYEKDLAINPGTYTANIVMTVTEGALQQQ